jgi:Ion channel
VSVLALVLLGSALALVTIKSFGATVGLVRQIHDGGVTAEKLRQGRLTERELRDFILSSGVFMKRIYGLKEGRGRQFLLTLMRGWMTVSIGALVTLLLAPHAHSSGSPGAAAWLSLALGIATAFNAMILVITAVVRRLILGAEDARSPDVQLPGSGPTHRWAVTHEHGSNLPVYFLVLVYMIAVSFAALYAGLTAWDGNSFAHAHFGPSILVWIYFSLSTVATVGLGDIHPMTTAAVIAVTMEIAAGPLLLSWLLAVFMGGEPAVFAHAKTDEADEQAG